MVLLVELPMPERGQLFAISGVQPELLQVGIDVHVVVAGIRVVATKVPVEEQKLM